MNRFFGFSRAQVRILTVLAVLIVVGGVYQMLRDRYGRSVKVNQGWRVENLQDFRSVLVLDPNLAPADSLELVPGLGPVLSQRIIEYRSAHGPFAEVDSLINVPGIGPEKMEQLRAYLKIGQP